MSSDFNQYDPCIGCYENCNQCKYSRARTLLKIALMRFGCNSYRRCDFCEQKEGCDENIYALYQNLMSFFIEDGKSL